MNTQEQTNIFEEAEFAFVVIKTESGEVKVVPFPESEAVASPPSLDDVHNACSSVIRNIDAQHVAHVVRQSMVQTAQEMNKQPSIVVPGQKNMRPKR